MGDEIRTVGRRNIARHGKNVGGNERTAFLVENEHVLDLRQLANEVLKVLVQLGFVLPDFRIAQVVDQTQHVAHHELLRLERGSGADIEKVEGPREALLVLPLRVAVGQPARPDEQQDRHHDGGGQKDEGRIRRCRAAKRPGLQFQESPHVRLAPLLDQGNHEIRQLRRAVGLGKGVHLDVR